MRLKALQGLDREKLEKEYQELEERIAYFNQLLSSEEMLRGVLKEELTAIRDKYGDQRYTEIQDVEDEIDIEDLIEEEQCVFTLTQAWLHQAHPGERVRRPVQGRYGQEGHHHPGGRTPWWMCSPPPPMTTCCSLPTLVRCTGKGLSDPGERKDRQGDQPGEYPPGGAGKAGPDHAHFRRPGRKSSICSWSPVRARSSAWRSPP